MENFEIIKKYYGWFIVPFYWIAYYIDYGVSHIGPFPSDFPLIGNNQLLLYIMSIGTIFVVVFAILTLWQVLVFVSVCIFSNMAYIVCALILFCFGVIGLFKNMDIMPFQNVNLFWHLGSLSCGLWLFKEAERISILKIQ